jgi:hypothetical protein
MTVFAFTSFIGSLFIKSFAMVAGFAAIATGACRLHCDAIQAKQSKTFEVRTVNCSSGGAKFF